MKLIIDIPIEVKQTFDNAKNEDLYGNYYDRNSLIGKAIQNGTSIPDNATNGDVIKAMFGADKVFGFIHYVHLMAQSGNWFNEGVVAEFDKDWWNALYQKMER